MPYIHRARQRLALELSALPAPGVQAMRPFLDELAEDPDNEALREMIEALLLDRTIHLLRRGSRLDLVDESFELADFLESEAGERLSEARPRAFAAWDTLEEIFAKAADRNNPDAVESILRSHRGQGQKVLEFLAEHHGPVRRTEVNQAKVRLQNRHLATGRPLPPRSLRRS